MLLVLKVRQELLFESNAVATPQKLLLRCHLHKTPACNVRARARNFGLNLFLVAKIRHKKDFSVRDDAESIRPRESGEVSKMGEKRSDERVEMFFLQRSAKQADSLFVIEHQ